MEPFGFQRCQGETPDHEPGMLLPLTEFYGSGKKHLGHHRKTCKRCVLKRQKEGKERSLAARVVRRALRSDPLMTPLDYHFCSACGLRGHEASEAKKDPDKCPKLQERSTGMGAQPWVHEGE